LRAGVQYPEYQLSAVFVQIGAAIQVQ
jgi:hypothetical protein